MNDSQHLLSEYFNTIHNSPSQIYYSALLFSPPSSWLHKYYSVELSQEVKVVKGLPAEWEMCSRTVALDNYPQSLACWKDTIAVGLGSGDITILNRATGSQAATLSEHTDIVRSLAFSQDGTLLVSGSDDKTVKLWDVQTGGVIKAFCAHTHFVLSVTISVDCVTIASGSLDRTIHLWDIQTGECHHIIKQQEGVWSVRFSPTDPQHLISVSADRVWQWDTGGYQIGPTYDGSHIAFSPDGTQFVLCHETAVVVQKSHSGEIVTGFHVVNNDAKHCCFSPDGSLLAVAAGNTVCVWDIINLDPHIVETFVGHTSTIISLAFSSPSSLISLSNDQSVKFWQIGASLTDLAITNPKVTSPSLAPIKSITLQVKDGIAISSDVNGVIRTWDISTGLCKASFQTPAKNYHLSDVRLINNGLVFVWQVSDKIYIWDVEKGKLLQAEDAPQDRIEDIRISGDGSKVFCLCWSFIQALSIWTGQVVGGVKLEVSMSKRSLSVDGPKVWVHSPVLELQGWDFGISGSPPIHLSNIPPPYLTDTKLWDIHQSRIKDTVTGKVVFQLGGRFTKPVDSQWDCWYLAAGYQSGEMLILDFNHMAPK